MLRQSLDKLCFFLYTTTNVARMVELVDTLVSGTRVLTDVQVQVLFRANYKLFSCLEKIKKLFFLSQRLSIRLFYFNILIEYKGVKKCLL